MSDASSRLKELNVEQAVRERYSSAAACCEDALCCATDYHPDLLQVIPAEVLERDYGCGDPTAYIRHGETVVDLGAGGGKACFVMSQIVGPQGRVIGVDCNLKMLALARQNLPIVAERLGYSNVEFRCGMIQDLRLDLDLLVSELAQHPIEDLTGWLRLRDREDELRHSRPMIADVTADCVVSNCVLNLVRPADRDHLLSEVYRVLKPGGRVAISDIVANQDVPAVLQQDPKLWSGCISGAYREDRLLAAFANAGFSDIVVDQRRPNPWRIEQGIEFRSITVTARKAEDRR
jgi:arsenite methyltransferase